VLAKLRSPRVLLVGVVALLAVFGLAYFALFNKDSPPELSLETTKGATEAPAPPSGELAGTWAVGDGSIAGYRVREKLAQLPAPSDAVGRTGAITGQFVLTRESGAYQVDKADFTVDVSQLKSTPAEDRRDKKMRTIGLETDKFPQATFALTSPISIPADAADGKAVTVQSEGNLTLHGATKKVSIPLQVQRDGAQIKIVGNYQFTWSDFAMTAPSVQPFVTVTGDPKLEFSLLMAKQT
jgi:polyisoprenoid-binding protein YceI